MVTDDLAVASECGERRGADAHTTKTIPSLTEYGLLGRSGLRVSPLCLGTMTFGTEFGWGAPKETAHRLLDRYLEVEIPSELAARLEAVSRPETTHPYFFFEPATQRGLVGGPKVRAKQPWYLPSG